MARRSFSDSILPWQATVAGTVEALGVMTMVVVVGTADLLGVHPIVVGVNTLLVVHHTVVVDPEGSGQDPFPTPHMEVQTGVVMVAAPMCTPGNIVDVFSRAGVHIVLGETVFRLFFA